MALYLGIDMGTSSIKACLVDEEGNILRRAKRKSSILNPGAGLYEVDAEATWWKNVCAICRELCALYPASSIRALCVSSVCGSFVPVDASFRPVHNAVLYGIDRRSEALLAPLNARYGADFLRERLGAPFSTHAILPKILWFKREKPEIYEAAAHFVSSSNFVSSRLTGAVAWDLPTAYGALMLDAFTERAAEWFLEDQGVDPRKIPPVACALQPLGEVTAAAASETGLAPGTTVMLGACDVNAEAMAVGAILPETAVAVFGSTISLLLNTGTPHRLDGFMPGRSLAPGVWRLGAATASGGRSVNWGKALCPAAAPRTPSGPSGIVFVPYLDGARTPFNNPSARGAFFGLTHAHGPADMYRAIQEALGYELALIISRLERVAPFPALLDVSGGLTRAPGLLQMIADITGRKLRAHPASDASFGDARIAMLADMRLEDLPSLAGNVSVRSPAANAPRYAQCTERFAAFSELLGKTDSGESACKGTFPSAADERFKGK